MPDDPEAIRQLAIAQWTRTVAFRETIEAMHADGLRLFVDVGARGNLAGFVEDILRGKPAFAIAANLPRRSGLTQLNHLVAATFAQGASLNTDYLYAATPTPPHRLERDRTTRPDDGRAENRLSRNAVVGRSDRAVSSRNGGHGGRPALDQRFARPDWHASLRKWRASEQVPGRNQAPATRFRGTAGPGGNAASATRVCCVLPTFTLRNHRKRSSPPWQPPRRMRVSSQPDDAERDDAMLLFQETMQAFLQTQQEVMAAYLGAAHRRSFGFTASGGGDTGFRLPSAERAAENTRGLGGLVSRGHDDLRSRV